ncbi:MAG TPA: hypothetical protein VHU87_05615 [Rhizomicrobium sp.]|jgi:uncharacterized membrane protein|nr:hypothetical protein [Rhizomicrobium sp.]
MSDATGAVSEGSFRTTAVIGYLLFLVGWPCLHFSTVMGLVLAYVQRGDSRGTIWESHFSNMIEVFWISLLLTIVAVPLCFVGVGFLLLAFTIVWFLYRTIKGLIRALDGRPYY